MLDTGYWMLDTGCWILDPGCWMLDTGCWMLDSGLLDGGCFLEVEIKGNWSDRREKMRESGM